MKQLSIEYCTRCRLKTEPESDLLSELAYNEDRYIPDLLKQAQENPESALYKEAAKQMELRLENEAGDGEPDDTIGPYLTDDEPEFGSVSGLPRQDINEEDVRRALEEYETGGLIDIQKGKVIVTSRAVKKLAADALERILRELSRKTSGSNPVEKEDFGVDLSLRTRRYEAGDNYSSVDLVSSAINAVRRSGRLEFESGDFEVYEEIHQSRLNAAIIIDESGSMRDSGKLEAARETALALSKLILREPDNTLKVFIFSDEVRQIEPWEIVNEVISGGDTDIRAALAAFRRACSHEYGDKQAYLITDTEPNNEGGRHLTFDKAANGLIEEAARYRQEKIGLNIIMLDQGSELKSLASTIAKKNLGRVFFTSPDTLGEVLVEDYLRGRRE